MSTGLPFFLADNLLAITQYPNVTLTGNEELAGSEAFHVADGRRSGASYWSPITPNHDAFLTWTDGRTRYVDALALDRGHNLGGFIVQLQASNDNVTWQNLFNLTIPTICTAGRSLDAATGAVTEEGAWIIRFPGTAALYWRFYVPAMGVGLLPNVPGLWVGKSWYPAASATGGWLFNLPVSEGGATLQAGEATAESGWVARGSATPRKEGTIPFKLTTVWDYDFGRLNLESLYGEQGTPAWVLFDDSAAERAFMIERVSDQLGFVREQGYFFKQINLTYRERESLRA